MTTQTLLKPQEKQGTWSLVFPNETTTEQKSALFVKKLLAVAVSNITYLRDIFPEPAFGDRSLEGLNLKILKDESSCPGACQVIKWIKGCFDALDKKFLKALIIGIYTDPNDPKTVIESYTFKFSYTENSGIDIYRNSKKISSAYSDAETKKATIKLLRTILVLTQSLDSLPADVMMTMKLLYYDEVTPTDYEPPGFKPSEEDSFEFEEKPMNIQVGDVVTPFHTVKLRIKTDKKQFAEDVEEKPETITEEVEEEEKEESLKLHIEENEISNTGLDLTEDDNKIETLAQNEKRKKGKSKLGKKNSSEQVVPVLPPEPAESADVPDNRANDPEQAVETTGSQSSQIEMEEDLNDNGVKCCCGYNDDDGLMILCAKCRCWQHGICFKIMDENEAPERHICNECGNLNDPELLPTDPTLHNLDELVAGATCLWRKALMACTESTRMQAPGMAKRLGVEMPVAQGLVNRLEKEGYLKAPVKGKRHGKTVDKTKLELGIQKYFKKTKQLNETKEEENTSQMEVSQEKEEQDLSEIDKLTLQAESLDVSGKNKPLLPAPEAKKSKLKIKTSKSKSKRVRALVDNDDFEFDVEDSEEQSQTAEKATKRRKKVSDVTRPLRV